MERFVVFEALAPPCVHESVVSGGVECWEVFDVCAGRVGSFLLGRSYSHFVGVYFGGCDRVTLVRRLPLRIPPRTQPRLLLVPIHEGRPHAPSLPRQHCRIRSHHRPLGLLIR